jgi:hypothetical protein
VIRLHRLRSRHLAHPALDADRSVTNEAREIEMLVMMRYRFAGGSAGREAYERFSKWTPSEGFEIKAGWTSASNDGGFLLLEVADVATLLDFSAKFKDLNDELDITPVVELGEGVGIAMGAYAWVDSLA